MRKINTIHRRVMAVSLANIIVLLGRRQQNEPSTDYTLVRLVTEHNFVHLSDCRTAR